MHAGMLRYQGEKMSKSLGNLVFISDLRQTADPRAIRLAVLIDRGHRELPIRADFVGKNIATALGDDVRVDLVETGGSDTVELVAAAVPA